MLESRKHWVWTIILPQTEDGRHHGFHIVTVINTVATRGHQQDQTVRLCYNKVKLKVKLIGWLFDSREKGSTQLLETMENFAEWKMAVCNEFPDGLIR